MKIPLFCQTCQLIPLEIIYLSESWFIDKTKFLEGEVKKLAKLDGFGNMSGVNMEINNNNNNTENDVEKKGGGDTTGINANNIVPEPIKTHNEEVLKRFHKELIKLLNRWLINRANADAENAKSAPVNKLYCTPNGHFVFKLTPENEDLNYLLTLIDVSLPQDIKDNKRMKAFLETNQIDYSNVNTIGSFVSLVKDRCNRSPTKLEHIKRMSKSKERELADQYLVSNLLNVKGDKTLSEFMKDKEKIQEKAKKFHNKTLRQQNIPLYERFFDKINRLWFLVRFRVGNKVNYNNFCKRDWDTGKLTR